MVHYPLIDVPTLAILVRHEGRLHMLPVDGNHRMKAREIMGFKTFSRFVVPEEIECEYRVQFREV